MSALRSLSAANSRQVLVGGRVSDAITGRSVAVAELTLSFDAVGDGDFRPLHARLARPPGGWFAYSVAPEMVPAATGAAPTFRLEGQAAGHAPALATLEIDGTALARVLETRPIGGQSTTLTRIQAAPFRLDLTLPPLAVALEGHVYQSGDPDEPAANATVAVIAPAGATTATDAAGRFRIAALPVAATVTLRITHDGASVDHPFRPAFTQRTNRAVFTTA